MAENVHQPTRRKEKCMIKFKSPPWVQRTLSLMGKVRNLFAVEVGRYKNKRHHEGERPFMPPAPFGMRRQWDYCLYS